MLHFDLSDTNAYPKFCGNVSRELRAKYGMQDCKDESISVTVLNASCGKSCSLQLSTS